MQYIPLVLGRISFGVQTTTFNRLSKNYASNWVKQNRINNKPVLQHTGEQAETMTISGLSFANSLISSETLSALRALSESKTSQFLFDLDGFIYGKWAITSIKQESDEHNQTTYSIDLMRYPESTVLSKSKAAIKTQISSWTDKVI